MIFLSEVNEGVSYRGIFGYEMPVIVRESKEGADFF